MSQRIRRTLLTLCLAVAALAWSGGQAQAHGFTSTVYADVVETDGRPRTTLELEYDLLVVSAADAEDDDALFREGTAAFDNGDDRSRARVLDTHAKAVTEYVTGRFLLSSGGTLCTARPHGGASMTRREGVPYAVLTLDWSCPDGGGLRLHSTLFPDREQYVKDTKTIVTYTVDGLGKRRARRRPPVLLRRPALVRAVRGVLRPGRRAPADRDRPHPLPAGADRGLARPARGRPRRDLLHPRPLRHLPARRTRPGGRSGGRRGTRHRRVDRRRRGLAPVAARPPRRPAAPLGRGDLGLDRAGWTRLAVVFCFGLVHGLGFAGALGIDAAWSWTLLWSLAVFNLGIEAVQLALVALTFPLLAVVRRRAPGAARLVTGLVAAGVAVMGLVWCVQRITES